MRVVYFVVLMALLAAACTPETAPSTTNTALSATPTTIEHPVTTSAPTTTSTQESHDVGLFRVDPATLTPVPGTDPLTTGIWNWVSGELSPNGEWLALHSSVGDGSNSQQVQVIETATGEVVTEKSGGLGELVGVSDDGAVYATIYLGYHRSSLRVLAPGGDGFKPVLSEFPNEFVVRDSYTLLDSARAAWLGTFDADSNSPFGELAAGSLRGGRRTQR